MKIERIEKTPFELTFKTPFKTAHGVYERRRGCHVTAASDGYHAIAELSPLEEFSTESLHDAVENFSAAEAALCSSEIPQTPADLRLWTEELAAAQHLLPSVRWAIEMLLADLASRLGGSSLSRLLNPESRTELPINGLLSGPLAKMSSEYIAQSQLGFSVYKVKVLPDRLAEQIADLHRLASMVAAGVSFRLDCNQALGFSQAQQLFAACEKLPIEYIEEPLKEPRIELLQRLSAESGIPIALDESLIQKPRREELLSAHCFSVLVLKPMLQGGIFPVLDLAQQATQLGKSIVLTSTLEGPVGIAAGMHTAAAVSAELLPCGFNTLGLFSEQIAGEGLVIEGGRAKVAESPGLGVFHL